MSGSGPLKRRRGRLRLRGTVKYVRRRQRRRMGRERGRERVRESEGKGERE